MQVKRDVNLNHFKINVDVVCQTTELILRQIHNHLFNIE